jgi:GAF domain-containing protein
MKQQAARARARARAEERARARAQQRARARARERARLRGAGASLDHEALPARLAAPSGPELSLAAPVVLPLVGLGLVLLLGAYVVSVRRIPWPAVAQPLYAHRSDVAAIGFGAIAVGLLLLNATVFL